MIETIKNQDGYIIAYIEWEVLDDNGQFKNGGKYIYIQNLWVHEKYRYNNYTADLSQKIHDHPFSQKAEFVYWQVTRDVDGNKIIDEETRSHKSHRMSKAFDKEYILNKIKGVKT